MSFRVAGMSFRVPEVRCSKTCWTRSLSAAFVRANAQPFQIPSHFCSDNWNQGVMEWIIRRMRSEIQVTVCLRELWLKAVVPLDKFDPSPLAYAIEVDNIKFAEKLIESGRLDLSQPVFADKSLLQCPFESRFHMDEYGHLCVMAIQRAPVEQLLPRINEHRTEISTLTPIHRILRVNHKDLQLLVTFLNRLELEEMSDLQKPLYLFAEERLTLTSLTRLDVDNAIYVFKVYEERLTQLQRYMESACVRMRQLLLIILPKVLLTVVETYLYNEVHGRYQREFLSHYVPAFELRKQKLPSP